MTTVRSIFAVVAFACALSFAAQADIEEAQRQEDEYCENVANGLWPDYNKNFNVVCKKALDE